MTPAPGTRRRPRVVHRTRRIWIPIVAWMPVPMALITGLVLWRVYWGLPTAWYVPLLIFFQLLAVIPTAVYIPIQLARTRNKVLRAKGMLCPDCLYDLTLIPGAPACPECGWDLTADPVPQVWEKVFSPTDSFERTHADEDPPTVGSR